VALIGYHASHEQFSPGTLLALMKRAEEAGFACAMSSDHFHPWSDRQGHSGFAWSWLGAALEGTGLPFGVISAPGYRYHPAIVAQGAATLAEMYPGRFWLALGSGEAINEAITGLPWPEKDERNALLDECAAIIRALFSGECVTHRGRVVVSEAKLYSRPAEPPLLLGAAVTDATAHRVGRWADGLITTQAPPEKLRRTVSAFREGGGTGPLFLQVGLCWAPTMAEAEAEALAQWGACSLGGEVNWDLRRPCDFDRASRFVRSGDMHDCLLISDDLGFFRDHLAEYVDLGFERLFLHDVGRHQKRFLDVFGEQVVPGLTPEQQRPSGTARFSGD
jgi:probable non-F420 flavinoid oxidoreductase